MAKKNKISKKESLNRCYEIILNYNCNAKCLFCSQGSFDKSLNASFNDIAKNIYSAYKKGYRRLGLTGGEPLLRPDIVKIISLAKSIGFDFIRIQTNGIKLSDEKFAKRLADAGLTFCKFSFLSDKAKVHDELVGVKGAWKKAMLGLKNLKKLKVRIGTNVLINRYNFSRLSEIIYFFLEKGISNFVIIYPMYIGSMRENYLKLGVSLDKAQKYFIGAIKLLEKAGLPGEILFLNVPPCFLKGYESLSIGLERFNTLVTEPSGKKTDLDESADKTKLRIPLCRTCAFRKKCSGIDSNYIDIWGWPKFNVPEKKKKMNELSKKVFFSDNERCFIEILKKKSPVSTKEILKLAKGIVLCRDCSDGNAVIVAAESLIKKKMVKKVFKNGLYFWALKG
ncbi:MAG: radical SAM protein [Elusimicrobiota bacterium]|nr:radical SAM protein [Elusimicrobiota bacterium]